MKILSRRESFQSDHSSTSYTFFAMDKPLTQKQRAAVAKLSSRCHPTARRVSFLYNVEGYDIPRSWEDLMASYYDAMARQDYDWWTLAMAFPHSAELEETLRRYECVGPDDLGVQVEKHKKKLILTVYTLIDYDVSSNLRLPRDLPWERAEEDEDERDEDEEYDEYGDDSPEDQLASLMVLLREDILGGDYRSLYLAWERFHGDWDEEDAELLAEEGLPDEPPPKPDGLRSLPGYLKDFRAMLQTTES